MKKQKKAPEIPPEHVEIIMIACGRLASHYAISYFTEDDIFQESFIMAMEAYPRWDGVRPLENFITTHLSRRLKNFQRDKYYRRKGVLDLMSFEDILEPTYEEDFDKYDDRPVMDDLDPKSRKLALKVASDVKQPAAKRKLLGSSIGKILERRKDADQGTSEDSGI